MHFFIENSIVGLKRIEETDNLDNYVKWFNDQEVNEFNMHAIHPMTRNSIIEFLKSLDRSILHLSVYDKETNIHIGNISLQSIDMYNRSAEFAIILGEKQYWGKGYSFEAGKLIIEHGYKKMNLRRFYCGTSELNVGMQKLAVKLGMIEEGRRKQALYCKGEYVDLIEFGMIVSAL
jgi:ribosomal-protein-alanine N-acetyltransferase